ncbi:MAG: serine/threonine protein kinase, partial [Candidatus Brocadiae bacterium]|nr:serine/threonine protein kinase [Candidatus Brocadiia bacterium]
MAKHGANCPKCGHRVDFDTAVGDTVACPGCQAALRVPGNPPDGGTPIPTPESLMATEGGAPPPPGPDDPLIGTCLDEFEIRGRLGEGGMGVVYEAWQPSLERSVAIKVLPRSISSDQRFIDRFVREARAAAAITHANIIEVHAIGNGYDHQYIAMELVEGGSLADVIRLDGPLPAERALDVMKQVASALAAAHGCGILHRDIKPSNILFTKRGRVKVADFGLAKHQGVDVTVTRTGQMLGTPLYIPPEAARGQPLDARSDLYSLGATFYHALAGRPPFAASTSVALAFQHAQAEVPSLRDAAPNVPQALCHIIHRLLAKNPDERYADACTLLEALEHVEVPSSQEAPTATEPGLLRDRRRRTGKSLAGEVARGGRTATRRKGLLIGGILGLIALISVLVAVLGSRGDRSSQAPDSPPATTSTPPGQPAALRTIRFRRLK